jgi:P4 family phage/plasmid primase-like protien
MTSSIKKQSLINFLISHKATEKDIITHTSMGDPKGKFCFKSKDYDKFVELYQECMSSNDNVDLYIVERQMDIGPIVVDIDFKQKEEERLYTRSTIKKLSNIYINLLKEYLQVSEIKIFILEKETPTLVKNNEYKDGFHMMFPDIAVNVAFRYYILNAVKNIVKEQNIFNDIAFTNNLDDIFDKSVVIDNGMLMYGSKKPDREPYKLTYILNENLHEEYIKLYSKEDIIKILSLRRYDQDDEIKTVKNFELMFNNIKENIPKKQILPDIAVNPKPAYSGLYNTELNYVIKLVNILSDERAQNYHKWLYVGWALHNISSQKLFDTFVEFSKRCQSKFDQKECENVWKNAKNGGYTIASLLWWAREDNPKEYKLLLREQVEGLLKKAGSGANDDIANLVFEMYKHDFKCVSISKNQWYEFKNHKWSYIEEGYTLSEKLSNEVCQMFANICIKICQDVTNTEGMDNEELMKKNNKFSKIMQNLKSASFQSQVMKLCARKFYDSTFLKKLNDNRYLLGTDNGVYDLKNGCFRNGTPDDYMSMTVGYDYVEYSIDHPKVKAILAYFSKVHTEPPMKECSLKLYSSFCDGTPMQTFIFWTGNGSNGKSTTQELLKRSFGEYYSILPHTVITKGRGKSSEAIPELADKAGVRIIFLQEPEATDVIRVGQMKELTGSDTIMARPLYGDPFYYKPQFQLIMTANKLPSIPSNDGGTWRRIRVYPHESEFIKGEITKPNQFKMDPDLIDKFDDWKDAFLWLLTTVYYPKYKKEGLQEPNKVLQYTLKYKKNSDIYLDFITSFMVETDKNESDNLGIVYNIFKEWYRSAFSEKPPNKNKFIDEMSDKNYVIKNNEIYGLKININHNNE